MVQSWQNFMAPTGGYTDNTFQFGIGSLVADLGLSVLGVSVANQQIDSITKSIASISSRVPTNKNHINSDKDYSSPKAVGRFAGLDRHVVKRGIHNVSPSDGFQDRMRSRLTNISNKRLGRASAAKWGLKGVGYGYLAMAAANIFESMLSPNYSMTNAAKATDNNMMQMPLDSATAYTQRQRALMAIHDSQLGIRGVIGNESQYFHR